ncbi:hypothetical protein Fmac_018370 [Flemingia macrophylla]|uniref:Uncharacterized protein n=1 Tax=Flemingia macrophylla TaxID=520843 RepID=A0ABD1M4S9_9FABA
MFTSQFNIQPTLDIAYESTPEVTLEIQSKSEEEATEMQTEQSKHVSRKRSWLVDVIEQELGRKVSKGEAWIATHKHANRDFVNDEARELSRRTLKKISGGIKKEFRLISSSIQVNALQSQLDEQNRTLIEQHKRFEERDRRFEAMMNFFAQNYQGHLPSNLAMFNNSLVSDQGSVPTNGTNCERQEGSLKKSMKVLKEPFGRLIFGYEVERMKMMKNV